MLVMRIFSVENRESKLRFEKKNMNFFGLMRDLNPRTLLLDLSARTGNPRQPLGQVPVTDFAKIEEFLKKLI